MTTSIGQFWVHPGPHPDEFFAGWMALRLGGGELPVDPRVEMVAFNDRAPLAGQTEESLLTRGILPLGGSGRFGDHGRNGLGAAREQGKCTATLMAEYLGVQDDPALQGMLRWVEGLDLAARGAFMDLGFLVGAANRSHPDDPNSVFWRVVGFLDDIYAREREFVQAVNELEGRESEIIRVPWSRGLRTLLVVVSDNDQMPRAVRNEFGVDMLVLKQSDGHVQILGPSLPKTVVADLARLLRFREQWLAGEMRVTDWRVLERGGTLEFVPQWHVQWKGGMVLNGGRTAPKVPPTRISLERIAAGARVALEDDLFASRCPAGEECLGRDCAIYPYGLHRCRNRRWEQRQNGESETSHRPD